jgi:hypothetical protein
MALLVQPVIAVTNGAYVSITAKTFARGVAIQEDGSTAGAGLQVLWPNGTVSEYPPSQQPIIIGNIVPNGVGPLVGTPAGWNGLSAANCPATVYCQIKSMGANTNVRVSETN